MHYSITLWSLLFADRCHSVSLDHLDDCNEQTCATADDSLAEIGSVVLLQSGVSMMPDEAENFMALSVNSSLAEVVSQASRSNITSNSSTSNVKAFALNSIASTFDVHQRAGFGSIIGLAAFILGVVASFFLAGKVMPLLDPKFLTYAVVLFYVGISVSQDLLIAGEVLPESSDYAFNPICPVIVTEVTKLVISVLTIGVSRWTGSQPAHFSKITAKDAKWMTIPACLFAANNIIIYWAMGENDAATFGILRDMLIMWTALVWKCCFGATVGTQRSIGICIVFCGLISNRLVSWSEGEGKLFEWAMLWIVVLTLCNAFASVSNEYALKQNSALDINVQNCIMYLQVILLSILILIFSDSEALTSTSRFFKGFTVSTMFMICCQATGGLLVSRLLKYADSVTRTVGSCLRGPVLVCLAPIFVSSPSSIGIVLTSLVTASGCFIYLRTGPLQAEIGTAWKKEEKEDYPATDQTVKEEKKEFWSKNDNTPEASARKLPIESNTASEDIPPAGRN